MAEGRIRDSPASRGFCTGRLVVAVRWYELSRVRLRREPDYPLRGEDQASCAAGVDMDYRQRKVAGPLQEAMSARSQLGQATAALLVLL